VNKKKQKNFVNLDLVSTGLSTVRSDPLEEEFFASFSQKKTLPSFAATYCYGLLLFWTGF